jgi:hypothetical protein
MRTLKEALYYQIHKEDPKLLIRELKKPFQSGINSPFRPDHRHHWQAMSPEAIEHPHDTLVKAELEYNSFQLRSGMDIINDNMDPQTAAELQNQQAALEEMQRGDPFAMENVFDPLHGQDPLGTCEPMHDWLINPMPDPISCRPPL